MRLVFLGLSLSSSWGNGHATTYRALLRALSRRGHDLLFLERDKPWYASNRDLPVPGFCRFHLYDSVEDLRRFASEIARADAVVIGSYVPDCPDVLEQVDRLRRGLLCFYDIDTPVTLRGLETGSPDYLRPVMVPRFDLYFSFTGGPTLRHLERDYGARQAEALYCSVDPDLYEPTGAFRRWDFGYLGTYSDDRQPALERLLIEPARQMPQHRFVVAGPQYPSSIDWPANVERIEHLAPADHAAFYSSLGWTLNVTRADMVRAGYSPSVRLFEATACGTPVISDTWPGLDAVFRPGIEILQASTTEDVAAALMMPEWQRRLLGAAGRRRTLREHTAANRATTLERALTRAAGAAPRRQAVAV
jgi:spore maturation protein CgeB